MKIFVACHKKTPLPKVAYLAPIRVGSDFDNDGCFSYYDNVGDNISSKNKSYCEMTAIYWIWKNIDEDIVGLCHYRRYFCPTMTPGLSQLNAGLPAAERMLNIDRNGELFRTELSYSDAIVSHGFSAPQGAAQHQRDNPGVGVTLPGALVWNITLEAIKTVHGKNECDASTRYLEETKRVNGFNMIIAKKPVFDRYCEWLFPILDETARVLDTYTGEYYGRAIGHLSEHLSSYWLNTKIGKTVSRPLLFISGL